MILALKDWIALSAKYEQISNSLSLGKPQIHGDEASPSNGLFHDNALRNSKHARIACMMYSLRMARYIVDCLARDATYLSDREGASFLTPEHIDSTCFMVEIQVPNGTSQDPLSAAEIMQKYDDSQVKSILEGHFEVKFAPALYDLVGFHLDEVLQRDVFQKLGRVFYELFTHEDASSSWNDSFQASVGSLDKEDRDTVCSGKSECKEEPESDRGRKKSTVSGTCKTLKMLDLSGPMDVLQRKYLPISICRLVTDLMGCSLNDEGDFHSLNDVKSELMQIIAEPNLFLYEESIDQLGLNFHDAQLFDRTDELSATIQAALSTPMLSETNVSSVVLISGEPGSGKSSLVNAVRTPILQRGWKFLSCKFDRLAQNQPLSKISSAFDVFFQEVASMKVELEDGMRQDEDTRQYVRALTALVYTHLTASGIVFLSRFIPSFRSLFPDVFRRVVIDEDEDVEGTAKHAVSNKSDGSNFVGFSSDEDDDCLVTDSIKNRLHYLFLKLTLAVSNPEDPMMLFLDDLQWADKESLDLITSLIVHADFLSMGEEVQQRCVCFVAAYRNHEECSNEKLSHLLEALKNSTTVHITTLNLGGISLEGTNRMIANMLKLPIRLTRPLCEVVHRKARGNPLFVRMFLSVLFEEHALTYSLKEKRWLWDIDDIRQTSMDEELALILSQKVSRMSQDVQQALTLVSCFGMRVEGDVLRMTSRDEDEFSKMSRCLESAIQENLLEMDGKYYAFPHDLVQQAAYERLLDEEVLSLHFNVGLQILKNASHSITVENGSLPSTIFAALEQVAIAKDLTVSEPTLRVTLATLFLRAGNRYFELAAFPSALSFFERGLSFMSDDGWDLNRKITLQLHDSACHACYLNALPDRVSIYRDLVISHTDEFMDQVKCLHISILNFALAGKMKEALEIFFSVIMKLDEEFPSPSNFDRSLMISTFEATQNELNKRSPEDLLNLPKMTDKKKQWAMIFLDAIFPYALSHSPTFPPLVASRMVALSLEYGLVKESAFGLNEFVYCSVCIYHNYDACNHWTKSARLVLKKFKADAIVPKLEISQYLLLSFLQQPIQALIAKSFECRQDALAVGDIEHATFGACINYETIVITGTHHLRSVENDCTVFSLETLRLNQLPLLFFNLSVHNMILHLIGSDKDPFDIAGVPFKNENEILVFAESSNVHFLANAIYMHQVMVCYFFRRYTHAAEITKKYHSDVGKMTLLPQTVLYTFYEGLVAFQMIRSQPNEEEWVGIGEQSIKSYQTWVRNSKWNFENKLLLLEAESLFSKGDLDAAEKKYLASIESARRHKFVHEEGLALDLLASFYKSQANAVKEKEYFDLAIACYEKWGAFGILNHICGE